MSRCYANGIYLINYFYGKKQQSWRNKMQVCGLRQTPHSSKEYFNLFLSQEEMFDKACIFSHDQYKHYCQNFFMLFKFSPN